MSPVYLGLFVFKEFLSTFFLGQVCLVMLDLLFCQSGQGIISPLCLKGALPIDWQFTLFHSTLSWPVFSAEPSADSLIRVPL